MGTWCFCQNCGAEMQSFDKECKHCGEKVKKKKGGKMMKKTKFVLIGIIILVGILLLTGCGNKDLWDTNYTFNRAIIYLNDGTKMELEIKQWSDFEGEQIQIIAKDGKTYLVSSYNTILIKD